MAKKSTISKIYDDLVTAMKGVIESKYIFCGERPDVTKDNSEMEKFVVIELPVSIRDIAIGKHKFLLHSRGLIYLFTKAKSNATLNVNMTSDFIESVMDLFPISGSYIAAVKPEPLLTGADEYGYHVTSVSFEIHTK